VLHAPPFTSSLILEYRSASCHTFSLRFKYFSQVLVFFLICSRDSKITSLKC
jgi:hypothetical protein